MMTISDSSFNFRRTVIAMAVFAFMASAFAQATDEKAKEAAKPEPGEVKTTQSSVTLGLGGVGGGAGNRSIYNQYNALGLNNNNPRPASWVSTTACATRRR
jgi:hypothetical protein